MTRVRSPNYPAISLPEAIERTTKAFAKENRHPAPRDVMVKALGFGSINGTSAGALSAAVKYGLLDKVGENYKVSDRAIMIMHPHDMQEKTRAIREAAEAPTLFADVLAQYPGGLPSDDNLRSYLIRSGFAPAALTSVIQALRDTMSFVGGIPAAYSTSPEITEEPESRIQSHTEAPPVRITEPSPSPAKFTSESGMTVQAQVIRAVPPGVSRATLPLAEGTAALELPNRLSAESLEDFKDWMAGMLRRAERLAERTKLQAAAIWDTEDETS